MKTIFDIGSNNGDDIPYYLLKANRVIAFEANPVLCQEIQDRFSEEIENGRLAIENGIICADEDAVDANADFYIHKRNHVLSQFPKPGDHELHEFTKVDLPVGTLSAALRKYGTPYYAKIDLEHYDHVILSEFFRLNVYPTFISAECHTSDVVSLLLNCSEYVGFKLLRGRRVPKDYSNALVKTMTGERVAYSFPPHSAGPFGDDIAGAWHDRDSMKDMLGSRDLGWKDLHACRGGAGADLPAPA